MSVTGSSTTNTAAASDRLARAISASKRPAGDSASKPDAPARPSGTRASTATPKSGDSSTSLVREGGAPAAERRATRKPAERTEGTRAAARGAQAAPSHTATGANAAGDGVQNVQSIAPNADTTTAGAAGAYTPHDASADAYAAQANPYAAKADPYATQADPYATEADPYATQAPEAQDVTGSAPVQGTGAWDARWQSRFEALQLAPADVAYLAAAGYDEATLDGIARELEGVPVLDPNSPEAGRDAGSARSADGPTAADVAPGQPGIDPAAAGGSAWSPQWEQKFGDLMKRMGMSSSEIAGQLEGVAGQPTTEEQLAEAYRQMEASLGEFDDGWRRKFSTLLDDLKTPSAEKEQVLQQLAGSGMSEAQLAEAYSRMEASKPAWNEDWETKFKSLQVPQEMLDQLKESGAPKEALEQQFQKLLDTKMEYHRDGRLEKLEEAKATPEQKWGVMMEGKKGKEFDKLVEQIHSSHVSGWKRVGSFALNLIPGAYAVQFALGKDFVTGEKIDRSNPLNIVGAVASGFAGFTAVRSAVAGVRGLTAANSAAQATKAAAGGAALADAVTGTSALSQGSFKAIQAAGLVEKFDKGLKFTDYLKSAVPIVNRFGEAGRLSAVGRGYSQTMQLAAGAAAMRSVEGGGMVVDKAAKAKVLGELRQGHSIDEALAAIGRTKGTAGGFGIRAEHITRDFHRYGFLQGNVSGRFGVGNGSGNFTLNPFKNTKTISTTADPNVLALGRGVNFGTNGGLAMGLGAVRGANMVGIQNVGVAANAGLASQAAARVGNSNELVQNAGGIAGRITGAGGIADNAQRVATIEKTAEYANRLGVAGGSKFRTLMQLGGNNRHAASVANVVENGASKGYRAARIAGDVGRRAAGYAAFPLVGGAAVGLTGRQMQPGWEYLQNRGEIQAKEREAARLAEQEAVELERIYQEQHGGGGETSATGTSGSSDAQEGATTTAANSPQVVGTSPTTGGQLVFDPSLGAVYDVTSGDVYDPNSGELVGNLNQAQAGQPAATASTPPATTAPAASAPATSAPAGGQQVYVDPKTGYYVDPSTGLMADPATGNVHDPRTGQVVANVNQPAA